MKHDAFSQVVAAHPHAARHRGALVKSEACGCFYCLEVFGPTEIVKWVDDDATALCPRCGIDAVLGSKSGFPITRDFLSQMNAHWF